MSGNGLDHDGRGRSLGSVLSGLAVAVGCVLFLGGFAWGAVQYKPYTVPTQSMDPTVKAGDRVLAQRISGDDVRRGDVVVFKDKTWANVPMVKRVVGIGGDTVKCCGTDGRLTVNGTPVEEPYLHGKSPASGTPFEAKVPQGQVFLLGDDRLVSLDSRVHMDDAANGSVPLTAVSARVDAVAWPVGGMLERPSGFAKLPGGLSQPGPLKLVLGAIVAGVVLILAGAAYGPVASLTRRRRTRAAAPAGR
ncbi:signal peptidase I [Streptomyces sp. NBC_00083]|uniref:signal peptidase I n=1 Tax=Streptomyces sp. NBC_00083 TaxID=2975647 RepID=UPI00224F22E5|nr:signal peptidase I [Streptomyces sp. NBC_00083]MCX5385966.1 signal peptidase I [Streptomyces sp. NBC_00083]